MQERQATNNLKVAISHVKLYRDTTTRLNSYLNKLGSKKLNV